jgi:hypothetical protein
LEAKVAEEGLILTDSQIAALEKAKEEKAAHGEIETHHPGYLGAQDTYYVGYIKGVGKIYQQTFIDTYSKVAQAKVYDRKNALVAADMLNDRVVPLFEQHDIPLLRVLTDRGTEFCGAREHPRGVPMSTSFTWLSRISTTPKQKQEVRKPMASVSVFIKPSKMSFTLLLLERSSTTTWRNCKRTWISGSTIITSKEPTQGNIALERHHTRPS